MKNEKIDEIKSILNKINVCCVSTNKGRNIKNRMMHFAFSDDFRFYLASIKTDPKTQQILLNSNISLLVYSAGNSFPEDREIEITGRADIIREKDKIEEATKLLATRSPVVKNLVDAGQINMLSFIEVIPEQIKYRIVSDILQGVAPSVIDFGEKVSTDSDWERFRKKMAAWIIESRYPFLSVSVLPVFLGVSIAWAKNGIFNFFHFILTLLGVVFLHLGTNIINDYFDHKSGNDEVNQEFVRPFSGGARMIQSGILSPLEVLIGAVLFFIAGITIGLYLVFEIGLPVLYLGIIGVVSGFFYTAPFLNWASRGIGEVLVGVNFGILITVGSYYVQTRIFSIETLWVSIPVGILVSAILLMNEFPDYSADEKTGKKTMVVRLGKEKSVQLLKVLILCSYMILFIGGISGFIPKILMIGMLSFPFALMSIAYLKKFYEKPFDMAPGNGFLILCFNLTVILFIISYLWSGLDKKYFIILFLFFAIAYTLWNYHIINSQREAFIKLKEII